MSVEALGKTLTFHCGQRGFKLKHSHSRSLGILTAIREASVVSKVLSFSDSQTKSVSKDRGRSLTPKKSTLPSIEAAEPPAPTEGPDGTITPVRQTEADPETFLGKHLPLETLFYLATMGGAEVCDLQDRIGNFLVGKEFDALLITTGQKEEDFKGPNPFEDQPNPALLVEQTDPLEAIFEKFLFAGDDRNVRHPHQGFSLVRGLLAETLPWAPTDCQRLCPRPGHRWSETVAIDEKKHISQRHY